jgi:hypothetical protein
MLCLNRVFSSRWSNFEILIAKIRLNIFETWGLQEYLSVQRYFKTFNDGHGYILRPCILQKNATSSCCRRTTLKNYMQYLYLHQVHI